ncbi:MAG: hypothetical protein K2Q18_05435, partial [Bdellovibrionales bacterium]|nr:hypothetical protein [Bdellovibrionales bacterium]
MKKTLAIILMMQISFNLHAQEKTSVTAYIEKPRGDNKVWLKTPKEDIFVDFSKLDVKTQKLIKDSNPKKNVTITFSNEAITERSEVPFGIRADCSEIPTDMDELGIIATKSKNMVDFLKNIPQGTLQGFTFVTNSLSLHRGKKDKDGEGQVSPMWPRVLRSSADGKLTVSFVCDPKNPTFGRVEIIHFDDKDAANAARKRAFSSRVLTVI